MKKIAFLAGLSGLLAFSLAAQAAVTVNTQPASLVESEIDLEADEQKAVFEFALTGDDSETLESVSLTVNSEDADSEDFEELAVYKDDGDGEFGSEDDLAGSNTAVSIDSSTVVEADQNNNLDGEKFFVVIKTAASWSGEKSITVTFDENGIETSAEEAVETDAVTSAVINSVQEEEDEEEEEEEEEFGTTCANSLINGRLYKESGEDNSTVYLAAACRLKPFRGAAVFHARGHKFQDIIELDSLENIEVSSKPALPAGGTLVKGSDNTVWFVTENGKRRGFVSEKAFLRLGFNFRSVKQISDSDLSEMDISVNIGETEQHPEGAVLKCTTSQTVYMVKGSKRLAFTNPQPYLMRGHTWDAVAVVDCSVFPYEEGENIAE